MSNSRYINLVIIHVIIGILCYTVAPFARLFFLAVVSYFIFKIITASSSRKTYEVLVACCYIVGAEVLFRMTNGSIFYESSKYLVILFILIGMFFKGISGKGYPYFIYLILLLPSVLMASMTLDFDLNFRTSIAFVLSGPVCLGLSALFLYDKRITFKQLMDLMVYMSLPIISMTTYLFLYSPDLRDVLTGTESNFAASGGFGPNQVSTILGLGIFAFTVRLFLASKPLHLKIINGIFLAAITFRALVTFSRGGVVAAIIMVGAFLFVVYAKANYKQKQNILVTFFLFCLLGAGTWVISSSQTRGLLDKRYANEDALGREQEDITTGRVELFMGELQGFIKNPFLGVGASGMKQERLYIKGRIVASHNEVSRLLSEHGFLGLFILVVLILKPLDFRTKNRGNLFFFAFLAFWFATINHSAMRIAAPGFIYALALLNVKHASKKGIVHRKLPQRQAA